MRVLLVISNYKTGFPYIQDLERELKQKNIEVDVLDVENLYLLKHETGRQNIGNATFLKYALRIPKIRSNVRINVLRRYFKKLRGSYDAVGIHSCDLIYIHLIDEIRKIARNLSVTMWGSDFYRASPLMREKKRKVLDVCDTIIFGNPSNKEDFIGYYKSYEEKSVVCAFGVTKVDMIQQILKSESRENIKSQLGLPVGKLVVTIGYNATPGQQHEKLIEELKVLPAEIKGRIILLLQMSYGGSKEYKSRVVRKVESSGFDYKVIEKFLNDEETANIRIASDIVLNAQITDGFSASIQEHLHAKNIVIIGDWLKYKSLDDSGVFYIKCGINSFEETLRSVIMNYDHYLKLVESNPEKMYHLSSWHFRIPDWIAIYGRDVKLATPALSV